VLRNVLLAQSQILLFAGDTSAQLLNDTYHYRPVPDDKIRK